MSEVHRRWQPRGQLLNQRALASGSHAASINARDVRRRSGAGTVRIIWRTQAPSSWGGASASSGATSASSEVAPGRASGRARGTMLTAPSARPGENLIRAATSTDGIGRTLSTVPQGGLVRGATPRWPGAPNPSRVSCPPRSSTDGLGRRARIITPPREFRHTPHTSRALQPGSSAHHHHHGPNESSVEGSSPSPR